MTISYLPYPLNLTEKFTQFLVIEDKQNYLNLSWQKDIKLFQNIVNHQSELANLDENYAFIYWLNKIDSHPLAKYHLMAYLESSCYWVVKNYFTRHNIYFSKICDTEKYITAFSILRDFTTNKDKLVQEFSKFNPRYSHIKTYSQRWLQNLIKDGISQKYGFGKYTFWGLLKNTSKATLISALKIQGYCQEEIDVYLLLWQCFHSIYNSQKDKNKISRIIEPTISQIQDIINLYQSLIATNLTKIYSPKYLTVSHSFFYSAMRKCHNSLTKYQQLKRPSAYAINIPVSIENVEDNNNSIYLTLEMALLAKEKEELNANKGYYLFNLLSPQDVNFMLLDIITHISFDDKKLLNLYYGLGLKQNSIAQLLNMPQTKVSREKNKINDDILNSLRQKINIKLEEENANNFLTHKIAYGTSFNVKILRTFLEKWLTKFYQKSSLSMLQEILISLNLEMDCKTMLRLLYGGNYNLMNEKKIGLSKQEIASYLELTEQEVEHKLNFLQNIIKITFINQVNNFYNINIIPNCKEINQFIETSLYDIPYYE